MSCPARSTGYGMDYFSRCLFGRSSPSRASGILYFRRTDRRFADYSVSRRGTMPRPPSDRCNDSTEWLRTIRFSPNDYGNWLLPDPVFRLALRLLEMWRIRSISGDELQ